MSHFSTSQPITAFYPKVGCIQFSIQKLQMLTTAHNDADNANDADDLQQGDWYNTAEGFQLC